MKGLSLPTTYHFTNSKNINTMCAQLAQVLLHSIRYFSWLLCKGCTIVRHGV